MDRHFFAQAADAAVNRLGTMVSNTSQVAATSKSMILGFFTSRNMRRIALLAIIFEAIGLLIVGQRSMVHSDLGRLWLGSWAAGLSVLIVLDYLLARANPKAAQPAMTAFRFLSWRRWLAIATVLPLAYYVFTDSQNRPPEASLLTLLTAWFALMLIPLGIIAWPVHLPSTTQITAWIREFQYELIFVAGITAVAFILRFYDLSEQAWWFSGDEGKFAGTAREVIQGQLRNPFETTFDAHAVLWLFAQGTVMRVFGDDIRGARMFSCLMGTATIPLFYLLVRRHFGILGAAIGAILLATTHFHIFMSRDAMNNISAPFFLVVTLLLLDQLFERWNPTKAFLLGIMLGLAQYAYVSNRLIIPIILTVLAGILILHKPRRRDEWLAAAQSVVLIVLGGYLTYLPQAAYFLIHPENFNARLKAVSVFGSGWLEREREITGKGTLPILWHQFEMAILLPFTTNPTGYYQINPPFIGWLLVIPAAIGTAIITANALRFRYLGWAVSFWAVTVGLSLTIGTPEINRYAMGGLLMPLTAMIGVLTVATLLRRMAAVPRPIILTGIALFLALNAFWNVRVAFDEDPSINRPIDRNAEATNQFAKEMHELGPGYTIYFLAAPQMYYGGSPNLNYLAEGDTGIDINEPWTLNDEPPVLTGPTYFFFVPERKDELEVVKSWFPNGVEDVRINDKGVELFVTYFVDPETTRTGDGAG